MISVRLPSGEEIDVDTEDPQRAAEAGRAYMVSQRPKGYSERRALEGAAFQGVSFGFGDELVGAATGAGEALLSAARDPQNAGKALQAGYQRGYRTAVDRQRAELATLRREHPVRAGGAELAAGLVGGGLISGAAKRLGLTGIANAAATGAAGSGLYGAGVGVRPTERIGGAAVGAAGGAALGGALAGAGRLAGGLPATLASIAARGGASPDDRAVRMIALAAQDSKVTPEALTAAANKLPSQTGKVREFSGELLGEGGLRLVRAAGAVNSSAHESIKAAVERRADQIPGDLVAAASRTLKLGAAGKSPENYSQFLEALQQRRALEAPPAYAKAYAEELDPTIFRRDILPLISDSSVQSQATKYAATLADADIVRQLAAINKAQKAGQPIEAATTALMQVRRAKEELSRLAAGENLDNLSVATLDFQQRGLRALQERNESVPQVSAAIGAARDNFVQILEQEAPAFSKAFRNYGDSKGAEEAQVLGRRALSGGIDELGLKQSIESMNEESRAAFSVGVMRAIQEAVARNDTSFVRQLARNDLLRQKLTDALGGPKRSKAFFSAITRAGNRTANDRFFLEGSRTAPLAADIQRLTEGEDELAGVAAVIQNGGRVDNILLRSLGEAYARTRRSGLNNPTVNEKVVGRLLRPATQENARRLAGEISTNPLLQLERDIARRKALAARATDLAAGVTAANSQRGERQ